MIAQFFIEQILHCRYNAMFEFSVTDKACVNWYTAFFFKWLRWLQMKRDYDFADVIYIPALCSLLSTWIMYFVSISIPYIRVSHGTLPQIGNHSWYRHRELRRSEACWRQEERTDLETYAAVDWVGRTHHTSGCTSHYIDLHHWPISLTWMNLRFKINLRVKFSFVHI